MDNLIGIEPEVVLVHGPNKMLLDEYIWHSPDAGIIAGYTPTERDVEDHFGVFRGVDQVEAFAQATIVSCAAFSESIKQNCSFAELKERFIPVFLSIGQVKFHSYLKAGEMFISIGQIKFYRFRQMACNGRIYKVPEGLDVHQYFSNYTKEQLLNYELSDDFKLIAELFDVTGRGVRKID